MDKRAQRAALIREMEGIVASVGDSGDFSDDQASRILAIESEVSRLDGEIENEDKAAKAKAAAASITARAKAPQTQPPAPSAVTFEQIHGGEPGWVRDPKKGYVSMAHLCHDVMTNTRFGRMNEQLKFLSAAGSDEQGTHSDPYGGFLVPSALLPNVLSVPNEADPTIGRTTNIPIENQVVEINARVDKNHTTSVSGGLQVYRREETGELTSSRTEYERITLRLNFLGGLAHVTEELLSNSPSSFAAILEAGFREEFVAKNFKEKLNGTGIGQRLGVLSAGNGSLISVTRVASANDVDGADLVNMRARCHNYNNAIWIANHDCLPNLMSAHLSGTNSDISVWANSLQDGVPDRIMNRPVFFSEFMPTVAAAGSILLADWSQYLEATKGGIEMAESIHVRFVNHESTFKFWTYNTGAPWWRSALTPNQGSNTLSPFVTLAAA